MPQRWDALRSRYIERCGQSGHVVGPDDVCMVERVDDAHADDRTTACRCMGVSDPWAEFRMLPATCSYRRRHGSA